MGTSDVVEALAFHPVAAECRLASGSWDRTIRLWDTTSRVAVAVLHGHAGRPRDLAFDARGVRLASASMGTLGSDNVVRIWDVVEGAPAPAARRERILFMDAHRRVLNAIRDSALRLDTAMSSLQEWQPQTDWSDQVRALALERFDAFATRPEYFIENAWRFVAMPDHAPDKYDQALHWAQVAARTAPENVQALTVRGAAEYRCGRFEEAVKTLEAAKELDAAFPLARAFLSMTWAALGSSDAARLELDKARCLYDAVAENTGKDDRNLVPLLEEAEQCIRLHSGAP